MAENASVELIARELASVATTPASTLFAGAGTGKRAGLPDWHEYVSGLADAVEAYDADVASLMRKRLAARLYLNAVDLYQTCPLMPAGIRLHKLGEPFATRTYNAKALRALVALPFDRIVTTNFDRSLHDAFALVRQGAPLCAELGDPSLKQAMYNWRDPYIARVHGRAEVPDTMVLDQAGYQRTEGDTDYLEFLIHILTRTRCAFLGYSFVDPAIHRVLEVTDARVASAFPVEHLAILPASADDLVVRLARYNIRVLLYDGQTNHEALWRAVREALDCYRGGSPKPAASFPTPLESAHRILAASYARAVMAPQAVPLRMVVLEGLTLGILAESDGLTRLEAAERLRCIVPMKSTEAEHSVNPAIDRLVKDGVIEERERQLHVVKPPGNKIEPDLRELGIGVANRARVRHGIELHEVERTAIERILDHLVLSRGWDLAAALASAKRSDSFELSQPLDGAFARFGNRIDRSNHDAAQEAIRDLLEKPNSREAEILARLARLSFGVEVTLERGRSTLVHSLTLPERIYLDASVLLPAITPGHPYRPSYTAAIRSLQEAATRAGVASRVLVLDSFLNEVVSHRRNAVALVREGRLEDPARLSRFIDFTGADYTNVYVGGYSSQVGRAERRVPFQQYLREVAPYETEGELATFLTQQGIETAPARTSDPRERRLFTQIKSALDQAYAEDMTRRYEMKPDILIRHEAEQLARLLREIEGGARSVFVTADSRLRRISTGELLGRIGPALFSHTGLLQLVDLLVGLEADDESLARLLWAVEARDKREALMGYFIDLALRRYDKARAMSMPRLVESIVEEALGAAETEGIQFAFLREGEDVGRTFDFLDRFEDRFYELMAEELRKQDG